MLKKTSITILLAFIFFLPVCVFAQAPTIVWNKLLGGSGTETADVKSIVPTTDGGYIVAASTTTSQNGDVSDVNRGGLDFWIIKLDATGNKTWDKVLGGNGDETPAAIRQTTDGGYIISGYSTSSQNGDVTGINHGTSSDFWIVKLDATGSKTWDKLLGSTNSEGTQSDISQTADGGYIAVTNTSGIINTSAGGDITGNYRGQADAWIVKLDAAGNKTWDRLYGSQFTDILSSVEQLADGTYIFAGQSNSPPNTGDITGCCFHMLGVNPSPDALVVKLDANGTKLWDRRYGSYGSEVASSIHATADGGFIMSSSTGLGGLNGAGDITGPFHGNTDADCWIVKLDADGNITWNRLLGGSGTDGSYSTAKQTPDGGYIVACYSFNSQDGDVTGPNHGRTDIWAVKLNAAGAKVWDKLLGGSQEDVPGNIEPTTDGGYIVSGRSNSSQSGDVTGTNHGDYDIWIVKLSPEAAGGALPVTLRSFTASQQGENVVLSWSTSSEQNSKDFIVQRSADGVSWTSIGAVAAAGNSSALTQYSYIDASPLRPSSSYRLQQRDLDDKSAFSAIKTVNAGSITAGLRIIGNPVTNGILQLELGNAATISIFNMQGLQLLQKKLGAGKQSIILNNFTKGSYTLKYGSETKMFVIQ